MKKIYYLLFFLSSLCFWAKNTYAQTRTIKGTVYSASDLSPLIGVNVNAKNAEQGVLTDANGGFSLSIDEKVKILQFALIGYTLQEVEIGQKEFLKIYLDNRPLILKVEAKADSTETEIVAIGYGTEQRSQIMSSIASISSKEIENQAVANVQQAMQARLAGAHITQNSGTPGGGIGTRIRGLTSINFGSEPLYVIDGVPLSNYTNFSNISRLTGVQQGNNYLATINPSDIASIDILKDAAASSIYGSRAAAGVVLITTKRGKNQKASINLHSYYGVQEVSKRLDLLNTDQYVELVSDVFKNANATINAGLLDKSVQTDWQDLMFRKAPIQKYDISIQGGTDRTQYFASGGYFSQQGVVVGSGFDRYSFRLNLDQKITPNFRIGNSLMFSQDRHQRLQEDFTGNSVIVHLTLMRPNISPYTPTGEYLIDPLIGNRDNVLATAETVQDKANIRRLIGNMYGEYQIGSFFTFRSSLGLDLIVSREDFFRPPSTTNVGRSSGGVGTGVQMQDLLLINENTLQYKRIFYNAASTQKHFVNLLVGTGVQRSDISRIQASASNFSSDKVPSLSAGATKGSTTQTSQEYWGMISYFSRLNYSFNEKYYLSFNFRIDGSSRFAQNKRYAAFPSASLGWIVSEEPFLKQYTWLNQFKLRSSWGLTGNQEIGNYVSQGLYIGGQSYAGSNGFAPSTISNPDLTWETTEQYNLGLDLHLFDERIALLVDYYVKNTHDLLVNVSMPTSSGFESALRNAGSVRNKGIEIDLTTKNLVGKFTWTSRFNIAFNDNLVTSLSSTILTGVGGFSSITREGVSIGTFWGTKLLSKQVNPENGNFRFEDLNKNGNTFNDAGDRQVIGSPHPVFTGGLSNFFAYKGFDFTALAQFVYGNDIFDFTRSRFDGMQGSGNGSTVTLNRWRKAGDQTNTPVARLNDFSNGPVSDVWLQKGSFLRLQTLSLGYTMPENLTKKLKMSNLRLYLTLQNSYIFTNYTGSYDPEVNAYSQTNTANGVEYGGYPKAKAYLLGLNIGF